ncbi:MAG: YncE family protein [Dysgonamonadaceae bacterium]|nr:YncE family protein [Dysgonamonadaceae bacterium]
MQVKLLLTLCLFTSCRDGYEFVPEDIIPITPQDSLIVKSELIGFYLLNEANMGTNKSTLDYMDFTKDTIEYHRDIYATVNPTVPKELGDVGNDLQIYGSRLYAVINCSNKVEVMDKFTAKRIGQIDIPNCRYIQFKDGYAYVTSYAGPVEINPDYKQIGYVAKVDTATLQEVAQCLVGFQPDELEIVDDKIYVANSGGYIVPNYENTVSVIDINSFTEIKRIPVEINLHHLRADKHGNLWVSSRGDYYNVASRLFWIDTKTDTYGGALDIPIAEFTLDGDSLYIIGNQWSYVTYEWTVAFGIVDVAKKEIVTRNFITDGEDKKMSMPYGIQVNPVNKDIYVTDAANYVYPGVLYCFDKEGKKKWTVQTGDIPAHFALLYKEKSE